MSDSPYVASRRFTSARPSSASTTSVVRFAVAAALLAATSVGAQPGPIGPQLQADDLEWRWGSQPGRDCYTTTGERWSVEHRCEPGTCDDPYIVDLTRFDSIGNEIGQPIHISDERLELPSAQIHCGTEGDALVSWMQADGCRTYRAVDAEGSPVGPGFRIDPPDSCARYFNDVLFYNGAQIYVVHVGYHDAPISATLEAYDLSGTLNGMSVLWTSSEDYLYGDAKVAADAGGNVFVSWERSVLTAAGEEDIRQFGRFFDADAQPSTDTFTVLGPHAETVHVLKVAAEAPGVFSISWFDYDPLGHFRQYIALDAVSTPQRFSTTTTTTLPPTAATPAFGPVLPLTPAVDHVRTSEPPHAATDRRGKWVVIWNGLTNPGDRYSRALQFARSQDSGRTWSIAPGDDETRYDSPTDIQGTTNGTWQIAGTAQYEGVWASRSTDFAVTWSPRKFIWNAPNFDRVCVGMSTCSISRASLATDDHGNWVAAWLFSDFVEDTEFAPLRVELMTARSYDDGATWTRPVEVEEVIIDERSYSFPFHVDVAFDGAGSWVVVWPGSSLKVQRSRDAGHTWSPVDAGGIDLAGPQERFHLASDSHGTLMLTWADNHHDTGLFGWDSDIFAAVSSDAGSSWSTPVAVNTYAAIDRSNDYAPQAASTGPGQWTIGWHTFNQFGEAEGSDADVVTATTEDGGSTWSGARLLSSNNTPRGVHERFVSIAIDGQGRTIAAWKQEVQWSWSNRNQANPDGIAVTAADDLCGNGSLDPLEVCDDGNPGDGDGCDTNCTPTACGNGIRTQGEHCDDGNDNNSDTCLDSCELNICGDGFVLRGVEDCDDANTVETDDCLSSCAFARCGDGHVHDGVEGCDDGNTDDTDSCPGLCQPARCGDGFLLIELEQCDDGNTSTFDACPADCISAWCGDGYLNAWGEDCDPADATTGPQCSPDCTVIRPDRVFKDCGDINGDGDVTAQDSMLLLQYAVGLSSSCPKDICDVDGGGVTNILDAQMTLQAAVGAIEELNCGFDGELVFWTPDAREMGSLQFSVDLTGTGIEIAGAQDGVGCRRADGFDALWAGSLVDNVLSIGLATPQGFSGPIDLVVCGFRSTAVDPGSNNPSPATGQATVVDSSTLGPQPLEPFPYVGYRLR